MKTELDCIPCFVRQTLETVRYATAYSDLQRSVFNEVLLFLKDADFDLSPPEIGRHICYLIKAITGSDDPYSKIKERDNLSALEVYGYLKRLAYHSANPLELGAKLAVAGNMIDFGANQRPKRIEDVLSALDKMSFFINHFESLVRDLRDAQKILYLADNAGEIVFDKFFLEMIRRNLSNGEDLDITVAVRGKPIINDATKSDAFAIGMDEVAGVIDNGDDTPGTVLDRTSAVFRRYVDKADLIISKGQGNYETLDTSEKPIYFLFQVKCPVLAGKIKANEGEFVIIYNPLYRADTLKI